MVIPVAQIQNVLRTYNKQLRIARLNSEDNRNVAQAQEDRVEISKDAREMLSGEIEDEENSDKPDKKALDQTYHPVINGPLLK